jgi:hypothetical protein
MDGNVPSYITAFRNGIAEVEKFEISSGELYFERISAASRVQYFGSARRKYKMNVSAMATVSEPATLHISLFHESVTSNLGRPSINQGPLISFPSRDRSL